jgi:hypothetical protein
MLSTPISLTPQGPVKTILNKLYPDTMKQHNNVSLLSAMTFMGMIVGMFSESP